ncbi:coiled-coil domain-containing protein 1-like [Impatiens glandulifera]|uniref:coiled-coil domain-containing protein 1-like n=1 Tax=Impatiens glandulifera TaxID=253017 RepID=UPI001FB09DAB|nr:coiled-coil domain-containing protein 1-like [Impatiens glandulifera]
MVDGTSVTTHLNEFNIIVNQLLSIVIDFGDEGHLKRNYKAPKENNDDKNDGSNAITETVIDVLLLSIDNGEPLDIVGIGDIKLKIVNNFVWKINKVNEEYLEKVNEEDLEKANVLIEDPVNENIEDVVDKLNDKDKDGIVELKDEDVDEKKNEDVEEKKNEDVMENVVNEEVVYEIDDVEKVDVNKDVVEKNEDKRNNEDGIDDVEKVDVNEDVMEKKEDKQKNEDVNEKVEDVNDKNKVVNEKKNVNDIDKEDKQKLEDDVFVQNLGKKEDT